MKVSKFLAKIELLIVFVHKKCISTGAGVFVDRMISHLLSSPIKSLKVFIQIQYLYVSNNCRIKFSFFFIMKQNKLSENNGRFNNWDSSNILFLSKIRTF